MTPGQQSDTKQGCFLTVQAVHRDKAAVIHTTPNFPLSEKEKKEEPLFLHQRQQELAASESPHSRDKKQGTWGGGEAGSQVQD